jgi:hypothetical protein
MKFKIVAYAYLSLIAFSFALGLTHMTSVALTNSTINSTPIGGSVAAAGSFTALNASGAIVGGSSVSGVSSSMSGQPASVVGAAGYTGWGKNGTGDMDFIAANSGASPSFYWYFLLGSTVTPEMWLDQSANFHVANGIIASSFQGNGSGTWTGPVVGNATTSSSTTGNAATASALAASPTGCGTGYQQVFQIAANGNGSCSTPVYGITTSVNSTSGSAGTTANTTVPLFWKFGGTAGSVTMPDTNYAASCMIIGPTGFPSILGATKSTTSVTVTIQNGQGSQGVISGGSEIDCTITGS